MQQRDAINLKTCNEMGGAASCKLQQNAEGCNSCVAGLVARFIAVVILALVRYVVSAVTLFFFDEA